MSGSVWGWLAAPVPLARVAWLRRLAYSFVFVDVLLTTAWVRQHAQTPTELYAPLRIGRLLPLPVPTTAVVTATMVVLLAGAAVALWGRAPRFWGAVVAATYLQWMVIAFSYGKVDHDRFGFLVLLACLATVGRARTGDLRPDEAAGWAVRMTQIACVATYFLAVWGKLRFGGLEWLSSAALLAAVVRRGTVLGDVLAERPWTLQVSQHLIVLLELLAPVLLLGGRITRWAVAVAYGFHLAVFLTVGIIFLPHLVAMTAFLPLERLPAAVGAARGRLRRGAARGTTRTAAPRPA